MPSPTSPPPRRHPTVLFDLDGTLVDSLALLVGAMQHAFDARPGPRPATTQEWVATIGRPLQWQFGQYATSDDDLQLLIRHYRAYQHEHHDRLTRAYDGIPALVARLHREGHPLGLVTSKVDHLAVRALTHVGLAPFIREVVGADRSTRHKPDPEPVVLAMRALGATPDATVFVGDSEFDVMAGNAARVTTIAVTWGASDHAALLAAGPAHVAASVAELDGLLAKLAGGGAS